MRKLLLLLVILSCNPLLAKKYYFTPGESESLKRILSEGKLLPGDEVILKDGVFKNLQKVLFQAKGTVQDSIKLKAEHPGKTIISGALDFKVYGEYLQIEGLCFLKAWALSFNMIDFQKKTGKYASHCRFTNCVIDDCNDPNKSEQPATNGQQPASVSEYWLGLRGENNRVDHCYFANKRIGGLVLQVWLDKDNHLNNHQIDHNLFGTRKPYGGNGAEIIRIGHSWSSQLESRTIVENNVFLHCDGESEIISVKSCHNVLRRNLFYESRGGLVCRHGHYNVLESNTFIGNNIKGTVGIRIINQGHTVYDNYMSKLNGFGLLVRIGVFEKPTADTDIKKEPLTSYHRVENVDIAYNHFINCRELEFGSGKGDKAPRNLRFANNTIYNSTPNVRVFQPEEVMPGITFLDNTYYFENKEPIGLPGFMEGKIPDTLLALENEKVEKSINGIGPVWYAPNTAEITYIRNKALPARGDTASNVNY